MTKLILHCKPENWIYGLRSADYLVRHPECNFVVMSYGNMRTNPDFGARRRKAGGTITVHELPPTTPNPPQR